MLFSDLKDIRNIKQVEFGGSVGFVFVYVCLAIPHGFGDLISLIREQTQIPEVKFLCLMLVCGFVEVPHCNSNLLAEKIF